MALMEKVDNMWGQMGNCRQRDGNSKNKRYMLELKTIVTGMKNVFDGLISRRLDTAEERINELRIYQ